MTRVLSSVDWHLPVAKVQLMEEVQSYSIRGHRVQAILVAVLAGLALGLASVGVCGLIAHSVSSRRKELGIRLALGATVPQAIRTIVLPAVGLAAFGSAVGCALAAFCTGFPANLLCGVRPDDPRTFAVSAVVLMAVAGFASLLPALRIANLNPSESLREE